MTPKARRELRSAQDWYLRQASPEIADDFGREFLAFLETAREFPDMYQEVRLGYRRMALKRFPYSVLYRATQDTLFVLAVVNQAQHPSTWLR